jgi:hypothetical protein
MPAIQAGGGGTGGAGGSISFSRTVVNVTAADQTLGKYTLEWNLERKTKHGDHPDFTVWLADQAETVPIVKNRDGGGTVTGYTFELSGLAADIYII